MDRTYLVGVLVFLLTLFLIWFFCCMKRRRRSGALLAGKTKSGVQEDEFRSDEKTTLFQNVRHRNSGDQDRFKPDFNNDAFRSDMKTTYFSSTKSQQNTLEKSPLISKNNEQEEFRSDVTTKTYTSYNTTQNDIVQKQNVETLQAKTESDLLSSSMDSSMSSDSFDHVDVLKVKTMKKDSYKKSKHVEKLAEKFKSTDEVTEAMRRAGLEHCNLIFGVDYTASNYKQGKKTFGDKYLHKIDPEVLNPYQKVIKVLGKTLHSFASDGTIPAFGFGDMTTKDRAIFSLNTSGLCVGFEDVLKTYDRITPTVRPSGPTNFAPLIYQAISIVKATSEYHILVIVADGQVTSERETTEAIVNASNYPLSIIMVGVGDGPWDTMDEYDNKLPTRKFDNFEFVDFHKVTETTKNADASFALHALKEIPTQYKDIKDLGYLK